MLQNAVVFTSFSTNDLTKTKDFYANTLGLEVSQGEPPMDMITLHLKGDHRAVIYPKDDHQPATYTVLNFIVDDVEKAVDELTAKGVQFEQYKDMTDEKGIARGIAAKRGPDIAWFKDPVGNILAVLQEA